MGLRTRRLGRTDLAVTEISLGGVAFTSAEQDKSGAIINAALDAGVNYIDVYVGTGKVIGPHLAKRRDEFVLSTRGKPADIDRCLTDLNVEMIDLFLVTMVDSEAAWQDAVQQIPDFERARQAGKIRFAGIGTHNPSLYEAIARHGFFDCIMLPFNYVEQDITHGFLDVACEQDVGLIAMKPLAGGNIRCATPALKYVLDHSIATAVIGMYNVAEVEEDCAVACNPLALTDADRAALDAEATRLGKSFCRMCGHCIFPEPCPEGINIRVIMMAETLAMQMRRQSISDEELAKVDHCQRCARCEEICPYDLPIMDLLPEKVQAHREVAKQYGAANKDQ